MNVVGQEDPPKKSRVFACVHVQVVEAAPIRAKPVEVKATIGALVFLCLSATALADIDGAEFQSSEWRVKMTAPKNWQVTEQSSYPNVLLWMVRHAPNGKMLLSAERVAEGDDALSYANRTSELLEKMGFTMRAPQLHSATGAYWVDFDNGRVYLRQAFVVTNGIGYALTLSAPDGRTRSQHLRAFDYSLRSIRPMRARDAAPSGDDEAKSEPEPETPPDPPSETP